MILSYISHTASLHQQGESAYPTSQQIPQSPPKEAHTPEQETPPDYLIHPLGIPQLLTLTKSTSPHFPLLLPQTTTTTSSTPRLVPSSPAAPQSPSLHSKLTPTQQPQATSRCEPNGARSESAASSARGERPEPEGTSLIPASRFPTLRSILYCSIVRRGGGVYVVDGREADLRPTANECASCSLPWA